MEGIETPDAALRGKRHQGRKALPWCTARTLTFDTTARGARRELCGAAAPAYISYHLPADRAMRAEENHTRDNPLHPPPPLLPLPSLTFYPPPLRPTCAHPGPLRSATALFAREGFTRLIELDGDPAYELCVYSCLLSVGQAVACLLGF